jgi:hypothetical protein
MGGGIEVEVLGGGLLRAREVRIGQRPADVVARSPERLVVKTPPGQPGPADVVVDLEDKEAVLPGGFRFLGPDPDGNLAEWREGWWSAPPGVDSDLPGAGLERLAAVSDGRRLHVAVTGLVSPDAAVVGYVDLDPGAGTGVKDMDAIDPAGGQLDQALSCPLVTGEAGLGAELAFGTAGAWSAPEEGSEEAGWRDVSDPARVRWLPGALSYRLATGSLETSVELPRAGVGSEVALAVRLVSLDGSRLSNQTLPPDDPRRPGVWSASYTVAVPGR